MRNTEEKLDAVVFVAKQFVSTLDSCQMPSPRSTIVLDHSKCENKCKCRALVIDLLHRSSIFVKCLQHVFVEIQIGAFQSEPPHALFWWSFVCLFLLYLSSILPIWMFHRNVIKWQPNVTGAQKATMP